jgi:hypothetical protein
MMYYEGEDYYDGPKEPLGNPSGIPGNQLAAIDFDAGLNGAARFRVDYAYIADTSGNCP